jgi:PhzF family phenazine biosynthesis protein
MPTRPLFHVDAFTDVAFAGNPAAVVILETGDEPSDAWHQAVAAEMNLSETAFVRPTEDGPFDLRWFTPTTEVDLCGHATLATAAVLFETGVADLDATLRFDTDGGELGARWVDGRVELDFPATTYDAVDTPPGLADALGAEILAVHESAFFLCVDVLEAAEVAILQPDLAAVAAFDVDAIIVTALAHADAPHDFVSRVFGPNIGIPEDPVTGSAHCLLGPLWGERLSRTELVGYQASPRSGVVHVLLRDGRVFLRGDTVTIASGTIRI